LLAGMSDRRLTAALGYRRFTGAPRVLVFDTGYHGVREVLDAAQTLAFAALPLPTPARGRGDGAFVARLLEALVVHRPDYVLTVNHLGFDVDGVLAGLLDRYGVATASWFLDHPQLVLGGARGAATDHCQVFSFERTALPWLRAAGFRDPRWLPNASNERRCAPALVDPARARALAAPLTFVGASWWHKARVQPPPAVRAAARALARRVTVGPDLLRADLAPHLGAGPHAWPAAAVAFAEASMLRRAAFARALGPLGLRVHGDEAWRRIAPGVDLAPILDAAAGAPALFAASDVNVNVTAAQMPTAVNSRVFDVPACGGFLVTDAQEDVFELFREGDEVVVWRDHAELADKVRFHLAHPEARRPVVERARAHVEAAHRVTHRLRALDDVMRARFAR
jgi:spore maturation protein CgeB